MTLIVTAACSKCGGSGFVGEWNYGGMCDSCHAGQELVEYLDGIAEDHLEQYGERYGDSVYVVLE